MQKERKEKMPYFSERKGKEGKKRKKRKKKKNEEKEKENGIDEGTPIEVSFFKLEEIISTRKGLKEKIKNVKPVKEIPKSGRAKFYTLNGERSFTSRSIEREIQQIRPLKETPLPHKPIMFSMEEMRSKQKRVKRVRMITPSKKPEKIRNIMPIVTNLRSQRKQEEVKQVELTQQNPVTLRRDEGMKTKEEKMEDPFFTWPIGSPYTSRIPRMILHVDREHVPTLEMLQILLRDTYRELKGGEPGAYPVEFIANEVRFPEIQSNIITLDLSDGWDASLEHGRPRIERRGKDIVPKLKKISQNMFTGDLGFLIVNLPHEWKDSLRLRDLDEKLASHLSASDSDEYLPPLLIADPHIETNKDFWNAVLEYFGTVRQKKQIKGKVESISRVETIYERSLRREDWRRITLTERDNNESDEHYFLKASIVEGFVFQSYQYYQRENGGEKYNEFFENHLFGQQVQWIETEKGEEDQISDIVIKKGATSNNWLKRGLRSFFTPELGSLPPQIFIEVETGYSEGAFNFRKIREKLENYSENFPKLWIVIPSRLLFRGKRRAFMILKLATKTSKSEQPHLAVPTFNGKGCNGLKEVTSDYINSLYRE